MERAIRELEDRLNQELMQKVEALYYEMLPSVETWESTEEYAALGADHSGIDAKHRTEKEQLLLMCQESLDRGQREKVMREALRNYGCTIVRGRQGSPNGAQPKLIAVDANGRFAWRSTPCV